MTTSKKKKGAAAVAVTLAAVLLLGGTFAWQSISQTALNEASDVINPGGRLHDDFNGENKDVYVENFADENIYARIRLDEYFEIVMNKGGAAETVDVITVGAEKGNPETWPTHDFAGGNATDKYWAWDTDGSTIYMPTFNLNKDSLKADINGVFDGAIGTITDRDHEQYADYVEYADGEDKTAVATYDADTDDLEEGGEVKTVKETHYAKSTLDGSLMSMQEWIDAGSQPGEYWVYDEDGWVYWAQAIEPDTATGLLLDSIGLTQVMDDSWYYAINVTAQFITADDLGQEDNTGFYSEGTPTEDALSLLRKIGVDVKITTASALQDALNAGGEIELEGAITSNEAQDDYTNKTYDFLWTEGGEMSGGSIDSTSEAWTTLFINNENNWPVDGDGSAPATLRDTVVTASGSVGVYTQALDAPITLKNVTITSPKIGLYSEYTNVDDESLGTVTLEDCTITSNNTSDKYWQNAAVAVAANQKVENGAGHVVIKSGTYTGDYAVYVYSSGGDVEIYGGYFDGAIKADAGSITIYGGTFTQDPSAYVAAGYEAVENGDGTWTVQK